MKQVGIKFEIPEPFFGTLLLETRKISFFAIILTMRNVIMHNFTSFLAFPHTFIVIFVQLCNTEFLHYSLQL